MTCEPEFEELIRICRETGDWWPASHSDNDCLHPECDCHPFLYRQERKPGQVLNIELFLTPVSYNEQRYAHWRKVRKMNAPLRENLTLMLRSPANKEYAFIEATAELQFKTRHRRDEGNFRTPLEKILGDVLQEVGMIPDDDPGHFRMGAVTFHPNPGPPRTRLQLLLTEKEN